MRLAISGSNGLIGRALVRHFKTPENRVSRLVRDPGTTKAGDSNIFWDIRSHEIDFKALEGMDAVIHLSGANIAAKRWTASYKKVLYESRIETTRFLTDTLCRLNKPPLKFFAASAVGFYGNVEPHQNVDELMPRGRGFLAELCEDWEKAAGAVQKAGIQVIHMRFGAVLGPQGGMLAKLLPVFKLGLGGKIGTGSQMLSWIAVDEIPLIIEYLMSRSDALGAVNFVSPQPVSNLEFTKILGKVINRPTIFPLPSFAAKILFGQMADELLLSGAKVLPRKLQKSGYVFKYGDLETALKKIC